MAERKRGPAEARAEADRAAAESDRMRMEFLRNELQTGFTFAGLAETERSANDPEHFARVLANAEKGYATLIRFMTDPKHASHMTEADRAELTAGADQLRAQLDKLAGK